MRVSIDWLKEFVDIRMKPEALADLLTMGGLEVESIETQGQDTIFEIGVTPNRADCLSIMGVSREVAAFTKKSLRVKRPKSLKGKKRMADFITVSVKSPKGCPRYSLRVIDGVRIGPSPAWIVRRLVSCGVRPINNVVDATNYVMLETGQPLHAFDYRFLRGKKIVVQNFRESSNFMTLDGEMRKILPSDLLICDGEGGVALAGIMGGKNSEVSDSTTTIVLESAYFEPTGIRRTAKRLGLSSESSRRFERGVDPAGTVNVLNRVTEIICEIAGGTPTVDFIDLKPQKILPVKVKLEASEIKRILGIDIKLPEAKAICERLGMKSAKQPKALALTVPTYRPDITRPIDVIEEIARLYGYHRFQATMPQAKAAPISLPKYFAKKSAAREALVGCGFSEAVLMSFAAAKDHEPFTGFAPAPIEITNPLSTEESVMRAVLLPGLLKAAATNISRQRTDVRLFATGRVFHRPVAGALEEPLRLAGVMAGRRKIGSWDGSKDIVDFYDAKGAVEAVLNTLNLGKLAVWQRGDEYPFLHPGKSAVVLVSNRRVGFVGELKQDIARVWDLENDCYVFELDFETLAGLSLGERPQFSELSKFPFVERDLAIIVDEKTPSVEILKVIQNSGVSLVTEVAIFDVYRGKGISEGKKSMAYTIRYASPERTLTDEEVNTGHETIIRALEKNLGAVLRT